jgi:hypothetical protein
MEEKVVGASSGSAPAFPFVENEKILIRAREQKSSQKNFLLNDDEDIELDDVISSEDMDIKLIQEKYSTKVQIAQYCNQRNVLILGNSSGSTIVELLQGNEQIPQSLEYQKDVVFKEFCVCHQDVVFKLNLVDASGIQDSEVDFLGSTMVCMMREFTKLHMIILCVDLEDTSDEKVRYFQENLKEFLHKEIITVLYSTEGTIDLLKGHPFFAALLNLPNTRAFPPKTAFEARCELLKLILEAEESVSLFQIQVYNDPARMTHSLLDYTLNLIDDLDEHEDLSHKPCRVIAGNIMNAMKELFKLHVSIELDADARCKLSNIVTSRNRVASRMVKAMQDIFMNINGNVEDLSLLK